MKIQKFERITAHEPRFSAGPATLDAVGAAPAADALAEGVSSYVY